MTAAIGMLIIQMAKCRQDQISNPRPSRRSQPEIPNVEFDLDELDDANALEEFRFTASEIKQLRQCLKIPEVFKTDEGDM
jgi:hypothetical protein